MNSKKLSPVIGGFSLVPLISMLIAVVAVGMQPARNEAPARQVRAGLDHPGGNGGQASPADRPLFLRHGANLATRGGPTSPASGETRQAPRHSPIDRAEEPDTLATQQPAAPQHPAPPPSIGHAADRPHDSDHRTAAVQHDSRRARSVQFPAAQVLAVAVDASAPGATLQVNGRQVTVEGYHPRPGHLGAALEVSFPASESPVPAQAAFAPQQGFTAEEALFRTRWGWAAFDATQRALQMEGATQ